MWKSLVNSALKESPLATLTYQASVVANSPQQEVLDLMLHTDTVSEIQNTLCRSSSVVLDACNATTRQ